MTNKPEVYSPDELANKLKLSAKVIANHALQLGILVTTLEGEQYVEVADIGKLLKALKKNYAQALKVDGVGEKLQKLSDFALQQKTLVKAKEEARRLKEAEEKVRVSTIDKTVNFPRVLRELTDEVLEACHNASGNRKQFVYDAFSQLHDCIVYDGEYIEVCLSLARVVVLNLKLTKEQQLAWSAYVYKKHVEEGYYRLLPVRLARMQESTGEVAFGALSKLTKFCGEFADGKPVYH